MQELNANCFLGVVMLITLTVGAQRALPMCPRDAQQCNSAGLWELGMSAAFILLY